MNPRDRLLAALRGHPVDRVPLVLEGFHYASPEAAEGPGKREILERVGDQLHFFHGCPSYVNRYFVPPPQRIQETDREKRNGHVIVTREIDTPWGSLNAVTGRNTSTNTTWTLKYPVESLEDVEKIRSVPWELPPNLAPPDLSSLSEAFGQRGIVQTGGALSHIHCHGRIRSTPEWIIERGGDFTEPVEPPPDGDITFAEAKAAAKGRITVGGNIEARLLENEEGDAVEKAVRGAFKGGKNRMVLQTTAGPISAMTKRMVENYHRMIDA